MRDSRHPLFISRVRVDFGMKGGYTLRPTVSTHLLLQHSGQEQKMFSRTTWFGCLFVVSPAFLMLAPYAWGQLGNPLEHGGDAPIECRESLPEPPGGFCSYQEGNDLLLIQADVLTPDNVLLNGDLLIGDDGRIACAGCDCSGEPGAAGAAVLICPDTTLSPGLIDAYNDLSYSDNLPADHGAERYEHRHEWRLGLNGHSIINSTSDLASEVWGEFRAVVSGVTAVAGSGGVDNLVRNLADNSRLDGITTPAWQRTTFPLGDAGGQSMVSGCDYPSLPNVTPGVRYQLLVAEGIDGRAHNEFTCLSDNSGQGVDIIPIASVRHGIPLNAADANEMSIKSTSLIWSPRSDISLYGVTAPVSLLQNSAVNLALGSRWQVTGSLNIFRELQCARDFNDTYLAGGFSDRELFSMVTENPAKAAGMDADIGSLQPGRLADVTLFDSGSLQGYSVVTQADESDVLLVLKGGTPLYGDADLMEALDASDPDCETIIICGHPRRICAQRETGAPLPVTFTTLIAACGTSFPDERSCLPERTIGLEPFFDGIPVSGDQDGDGVPDSIDNCPDVFNPPLPHVDMQQDDLDLDGIGDACDSQPTIHADLVYVDGFESGNRVGGVVSGLNASGLELELNGLEVLMIDNDGPFEFDTRIHNGQFYSVNVRVSPEGQECLASNTTDVMGIEDVTDIVIDCSGRAATIYQVKQGEVTGVVEIQNLLVTACAEQTGYFVQTIAGDPDFEGADFSGIFVFDPITDCGSSISQADRIDILEGTVINFFGQIQLEDVSFLIQSTGNPMPEPVLVDPAAVSGPDPTSLEAVLVRVEDVMVTAQDHKFGEFEVDDALLISNLMYQVDPLPAVGTLYSEIIGVLDYRFGNQKLEPRFATDVSLSFQ